MTEAASYNERLQVREAGEADRAAWDHFLAGHPDLAPSCRFAWVDLLRDVFSTECHLLMATDDMGRVLGVLPLYPSRTASRELVLYSPYCGLVVDDPMAERLLLARAAELSHQLSATRCEISSRASIASARDGLAEKSTVVLEISGGLEEAWKRIGAKSRNMVRKGEKHGLVAERGAHNLQAFYDIYRERLLSLGVAIYGYDFFEAAVRYFADDAELIVARHDGSVVGGILMLYGTGCAMYPFQAARSRYMNMAVTQFLIWEAVRSGVERGVQRIDMGESRVGSSVYQSKVNFGGTPENINYLRQSFGSTSGTAYGRYLARLYGARARVARFMVTRAAMPLRQPFALWLRRQGKLLF